MTAVVAETSNGGGSGPTKRTYLSHMGPRYVPKYRDDSSPSVPSSPQEITANNNIKKPYEPSTKITGHVRRPTLINEDYEKGELGSSSTSSEEDDDSNDSGEDKKQATKKAKEENKKDLPNSKSNFKKLTPVNNTENIKSIISKDLVTPVKPVVLSSSPEDIKKLETEIKRLKEQITENETQRLNQKKQYQSKINNLMAYNDQLITITKQLTGVVETSTIKLTSDQSKEKELLLQIQHVRSELNSKQDEVLRSQEMNKMLMKTMDMYKQKFEERDYNTYQQTNQLLWGQIILWIFVVVIFVIVFSLFIKQTSKLESLL